MDNRGLRPDRPLAVQISLKPACSRLIGHTGLRSWARSVAPVATMSAP
jgi:hypothetical protein